MKCDFSLLNEYAISEEQAEQIVQKMSKLKPQSIEELAEEILNFQEKIKRMGVDI